MLTIHEIMKILPHRYPMLLVDRVLEIEEGKRIVGIKNVTANEQFFQGHFPGAPVMPGVLIVEAMAQCGAILFLRDIADREQKLFLSAEWTRRASVARSFPAINCGSNASWCRGGGTA